MKARLVLLMALFSTSLLAQSIQPVIVEYSQKAEGKFELTNDTLMPMAVILEPQSFGITAKGDPEFRPIDPGLNLELSEMSFRLEPGETRHVFYKAKPESVPAWFVVYATFSPIERGTRLKVNVMLPHTVYINQKRNLDETAVKIETVSYSRSAQKLSVSLDNVSPLLGRVREVKIHAGEKNDNAPGFPLLPGAHRIYELDWENSNPPKSIEMRFDKFTLTRPVSMVD